MSPMLPPRSASPDRPSIGAWPGMASRARSTDRLQSARNRSSGRFAAGVALRAALIGALVFATVAVVVWRHWYATALVLSGLALLIAFDVARIARSIDRTLAQFVDGLFAEGNERPSVQAPGGRLAAAIERALERLA